MSAALYFPRRKQRTLFAQLAATAFIGVTPVFAQNDDEEEEEDPATTTTNTNEAEETASLPNQEPEESTTTEEEEEATTTTRNQPSSTNTEDEDEETTTTEEEEATTTTTEEESTTTTAGVTITGGNGATQTGGGPSAMPTLTRGFGIPEYPAATVPPTHHAPFMQHSTAPQGTVFIAVGAILGAFLAAILLWRIIAGIMLRRSVNRAAQVQDSKAGFPAPPGNFYKYSDHASTMSLSQAGGRAPNRKSRGPIPSANLSQSNLFFSPTAAGQGSAGNRASAYLPSGFYAAGAGQNHSHGNSISLSNLRPESRGHGTRDSRITPPDSPAFAARRDMSNSSLHLAPQPGQRAPSAYLEDLLADDPSALPPPHSPPSAGPTRSSTNRF